MYSTKIKDFTIAVEAKKVGYSGYTTLLFKNQKECDNFKKTAKYLEFNKIDINDIPDVDEKCHVYGEGSSVFVVKAVVTHGNHEYGLVVSNKESGTFSESIRNCYKVEQ